MDLLSKAATVEGAFPLRPPRRSKLPHLPADLQPTVGVAVTLRREELTPQVGKLFSLRSVEESANIHGFWGFLLLKIEALW